MSDQALDMTLSEPGEIRIATRDNVELVLRPVAATDSDRINRFYDGLSPDDMQFRFLSAQPHLSPSQLAAMIAVDHRHREHLLAFDQADGALVASLFLAADEPFEMAEVAIAVAPTHKGHGVGWSLLHHAVDLARKRGIHRLRAIESRANRGAMEVEHMVGFQSCDYEGDATLALLEIDLRQAPSLGAISR